MEEVLLDVMYDIPSRGDVLKCIINGETVTHKAPPMLVTHSGALPLCTDATSGVPPPVCTYVVVMHGMTRLRLETLPLIVNSEVHTSFA